MYQIWYWLKSVFGTGTKIGSGFGTVFGIGTKFGSGTVFGTGLTFFSRCFNERFFNFRDVYRVEVLPPIQG